MSAGDPPVVTLERRGHVLLMGLNRPEKRNAFNIELLLTADIRVASRDTRFAQLEIQRGIYPFGGATIRLPREAG